MTPEMLERRHLEAIDENVANDAASDTNVPEAVSAASGKRKTGRKSSTKKTASVKNPARKSAGLASAPKRTRKSSKAREVDPGKPATAAATLEAPLATSQAQNSSAGIQKPKSPAKAAAGTPKKKTKKSKAAPSKRKPVAKSTDAGAAKVTVPEVAAPAVSATPPAARQRVSKPKVKAPALSPYRATLRLIHRLVLDRADDRLERTTTATETPLVDMHLVGGNSAHAHGYRPSPRRLIKWVLDGIGEPFDQTTFVDIGSGRGRVLFEAARYPFQRIVGVECAEELHEDASLNLRHWPRAVMRCREIDLVLGDALVTPLPESDLVVWMFDPFADRLVTHMAARLADHARRWRVTIVLVEPQNPMAFRESTAFRELLLQPRERRRIALYAPYPVAVFRAGRE